MRKFIIFFLLFFATTGTIGQERFVMKKIVIPIDLNDWKTDFSACVKDNILTLRNSVLYQDEEGRTHYTNTEKITGGILAKKQFFLENNLCSQAWLLAYRGAGLDLYCNGKRIEKSRRLPSTAWHIWEIPPDLLKKGINEFVFSGNGVLLIEPSLYPNRSARSMDGGKTWDFDHLGTNNGNGEYVVRLRLKQFPEKGVATSKIYDLLRLAGQSPVNGVFISAENIRLICQSLSPLGTSLSFQYRTGDSMFFEPEKWTEGI